MTPEEYVAFADEMSRQINKLMDEITAAYVQVDTALPDNLRPATAADIKLGQILYYKHGDSGPFWREVTCVLRPADDWKAYESSDGCRYGLHDAWVRVSEAADHA